MLHKIKIALFLLGAMFVFSQCSDNDDNDKDNPGTPAQEEGIQLRINNGAWIKLDAKAMKTANEEYVVTTILNDQAGDYNSILWKGNNPKGSFAWDYISEGPEDGNFFHYVPSEGDLNYQSFYVEGETAFDSPGSLQIQEFGDVGEYVTGTFVLEKAVRINNATDEPAATTVKIEGKFKVKRAE